jgi:hypothetical protein
LVYIRSPNRVNTLLFYGIPSVTSPIPQACHDLTDGETTLFAVSEAGWYNALKSLITQPELRNYIGHTGQRMVEAHFSAEVAAEKYIAMLHEELRYPTIPKTDKLVSFQKTESRFRHLLGYMKHRLKRGLL